ncbi:MAG: septal ring lytic transglycosylase RlpA family protein, partial [Solirubrobacterales bacterium]|nr:septal ring lytic transglycosylase RlpA family protein [Solirubrobacterales bacterium]
VRAFRPAGASWYGLYGDPVACGGVLHRETVGVAHKTLPCGTKVTISYRGRTIVARVIDRGPYISGREFDLTGAAARALHFDGVDTIWVTP